MPHVQRRSQRRNDYFALSLLLTVWKYFASPKISKYTLETLNEGARKLWKSMIFVYTVLVGSGTLRYTSTPDDIERLNSVVVSNNGFVSRVSDAICIGTDASRALSAVAEFLVLILVYWKSFLKYAVKFMQTVQNLNCKIVNATSRHEGRISVHEKWEPGHKGQLKLGGGEKYVVTTVSRATS